MTNPLSIVNIVSINPPGQHITVALWGDSTYEAADSGSSGGWQIVDRPRLVAATQWYDRSPWQLVGDCTLDSYTNYGNNEVSMEPECTLIESWMDKVPGTLLPPVLSISGPVPGIQRQWILYKVSFGKAIRDPLAGYRVQQEMNLTFYEYNAPTITTGSLPSPAQSAQATLNTSTQASSYRLYTARQGDSLVSIAANLLGNWQDWLELALLNNIRDPANVVAGQILKIPQ